MNTSKVFQKRGRILLIAIILILVISLILLLLPSSGGTVAVIVRDQTVLYEIDLEQVQEPYDLCIDCPEGGYNLVHVEHGAISVSDADCPDQICVHMGTIRSEHLPITCLPHRLVIRIEKRADS